MSKRLHVKYPLFVSDFNEIWIFCSDFRKKPQMSRLIKIRPVGAELFHVDRRTLKLIVAFRNFANAPDMDVYMCPIPNSFRATAMWLYRIFMFSISPCAFISNIQTKSLPSSHTIHSLVLSLPLFTLFSSHIIHQENNTC